MKRQTIVTSMSAVGIVLVPVIVVSADTLIGAVDPLNESQQRRHFLHSAGADAELNEAEFSASAAARTGDLIRPFDRWAALRQFDDNANDTIDFFEMMDYRKTLRKAVMTACDVDGNQRLTGDERDAAKAFLTSDSLVKLLRKTPQAPDANPARPIARREMLFDESGRTIPVKALDDAMGIMSPRDLQKYNERFDTDGDGLVTSQEMRESFKWRIAVIKEHFDFNGNGEMDTDEYLARNEYQQKRLHQFRLSEIAKRFDADGDGIMSVDEKRGYEAAVQEFLANKREATARTRRLLDTNQDGQVSDEERYAYLRLRREESQKERQKYYKEYDLNNDGVLDDREWAARNKALLEKNQQLIERYDTNGDGRIDVDEARAARQAILEQQGKSSQINE